MSSGTRRVSAFACALVLGSVTCKSGEFVTRTPVSVHVEPHTVGLAVGQTRLLFVHVDAPADARHVVWSSADSSIATVVAASDTSATVTGRSQGSANIRAISTADILQGDSSAVVVSPN
jgi:uncharacterized protein YjdB